MKERNESVDRAMQLVEEALGQVTKAGLEQIRRGVEVSAHIEAAERDLRNALRQLVMANAESLPRAGSHRQTASDGEAGSQAA